MTKFLTDKASFEKKRLDDTPSLREFIPNFAFAKFEAQLANFEQQISHIDVAITTKKGDHKTITKEGREAVKTMKAITDSMKNFIDEAESHAATMSGGA